MPNGGKFIEFSELGLGSVLKGWYLEVPLNQREYAWKAEHVTQLFSDFQEAVSQDRPYFLGTIVTIPLDESRLEVSDGQQRLATTSILIAAIRDQMREAGEPADAVRSIEIDYLAPFNREKREPTPKLRLNVDDNDLFKQIITNPGAADPETDFGSHRLLLGARDLARRHVQRIAELHGKRHTEELERWLKFLEHRALVVLLRVADEADAFTMFETLNDRGLRTSQADLIKNYLFKHGASRKSEVQANWSYMRGALESSTDEPDITITFLRHALILHAGYLREAAVYEHVQKQVQSESQAVTFARTLENLASVYVATTSPGHERWSGYPESVRKALLTLDLLDIKPMKALLLAIGVKLEPGETDKALRFLISLGVRLMIASSTRTGAVEQPLAEAAKAVYDGTLVTTKDLQEALEKITPPDGPFRDEFARAQVSNAKLARYYLRSLEREAKAEPEPWFEMQENQDYINLEHVLPRKPEDEWPQFSEDEVRQFATRLGNQLLMRAKENSDLKSKNFAEKKAVYAESPYVLTSQVGELSEWTPEAIEARQETLADLAVRTWPIGIV